MNKLYLRIIPLMFGGIFAFTACNDPPAPVVNVENVISGDPTDPVGGWGVASITSPNNVFTDLDALSGASIAKLNANTVAYVDNDGGYKLKIVNVNGTLTTGNFTPSDYVTLSGDVQLIATPTTTTSGITMALLSTADSSGQRTISLYNNATPTGRTIGTSETMFSTNSAPLHHAEAAFAVTNNYVVTGYDNDDTGNTTSGVPKTPDSVPDGTYISVHDTAASTPKTSTHTRVNADIGELVALAVNGNYMIAGGGGEAAGSTGGTAVFQINPTTLAVTAVSGSSSDGVPTHWMKDNGTYVIESKGANGVIKIWRWNPAAGTTPASPPTVVGSITVGSGTAAIRALQFDPADSNTAYAVSFNGGQVYKINLSNATSSHLFTYPNHFGYDFSAWMIEKVTNGAATYFVITGGYGNTGGGGRGGPGVALVFKNPPTNGDPATPLSGVSYTGLVRMLRTLRDIEGNLYFAAKDMGRIKFAIYKINED